MVSKINKRRQDEILRVKHGYNTGFFSNSSVRLHWITRYFNKFKRLPIAVCSQNQFLIFKDAVGGEDISKQFFCLEDAVEITHRHRVDYVHSKQFTNYRLLDLGTILPFIDKYFLATPRVAERATELTGEYKIDFANTVGVLYRGNDKSTETTIAPYEDFLSKAKELQTRRPYIRFLVQTDEAEFLAEFCARFPNSFNFKNLPPIPKDRTKAILPSPGSRVEFGVEIFAAVLCLSRASELIIGSGNIDIWTVFYRGHTRGVYQFLKNRFVERDSVILGFITMRLSRYLGKIGWISRWLGRKYFGLKPV